MSGPIRHIVMWRLRADTPEERAAARHKVKTAFEGLMGRINGLSHIEVGLDTSDVDYACDVVLVSEFADSAALRAYATHPEHLRVREELGDLRIARYQVDYPI
jgi:Stress responsive A/B Barrel Domain